MANAGPAIRYRLATDVFPGILTPEELTALRAEIEATQVVKQITKKQKDSGVWGGNLLGVSPNKTTGIKDVGTVPQFRHLVEMGLSPEFRPLKLGARVLFRLLSRDPDPKLLFEYEKYGAAEIGAEPWIREVLREAASAALAHGGQGDDPRVRGAAHRIANNLSTFLRSETAANPLIKSGGSWVLDPAAYPPTIFSVTLLAHLPAVQRERAGLMERIAGFLAAQPPKKNYSVVAGKKSLKPSFLLLGDPVHVSAAGVPDDLPFALHWVELLARMGALHLSQTFPKFWPRLLKDCDATGVWHPKNLRVLPKSDSPWAYHVCPLETDTKRVEARQTDITFRMALVARLAGWDLIKA